ncbi:MAG: SUMF1/EgtB/PvdO family nonheme iron enzyme [Planctomycetota bacterium]
MSGRSGGTEGWERGPGGSWPRIVVLAGLASLCVTSTAWSATHAVIISVPECRSGRYALPLAQRNEEWMRPALIERLRLPDERLHALRGDKATRVAIRTLLRDELPLRVQSGDRVIIYYTGHGSLLSVSEAPVRMYFNYETIDWPGQEQRPASERWQTDTVISDFDLEDWLEPLHRKGAETILLRECCFSGGGYSEALAHEAPLLEAAGKKLTPATYELSACSANENAYPVKVKDPKSGEEFYVGAFTEALVRALSQSKTVLTLEDVASFVEEDFKSRKEGHVGFTVRGQTPSRGGTKEEGFRDVVLIDRSRLTLVIHVLDAWTREELKGVKVFLSGREPLASPATVDGVARSDVRVYPWLEKEGFVPSSQVVALDDKKDVQEVALELEPEYAEVIGRLVESSGQPLESVQVACRVVGGTAPEGARFDTEARPDASGRFRLRVAPAVAWELVVFSSGRVLATQGVNEGKPLGAVRRFDGQAKRMVERGPYDLGTVSVTLPRTGPTPAELLFDRYFGRAQELLESGKLDEVRDALKSALDAIAGLPQASRKILEERVSAALALVDAKARHGKLMALEAEADKAEKSGNLDLAEKKAKEALEIEPGVLWADVKLKDIARTRERERMAREAEAARLAAEREAAARKETPPADTGKKSSERTAQASGAPRSVPGFTYRGKNAQGMHEYVHDETRLEFVYIPGGTFTMGSPSSEKERGSDETPHQVTLSPYLIAKYEVSQEVWEKKMGGNPSNFKNAKYPVENVSWNDVHGDEGGRPARDSFCGRTGLELPTEAQWEYACRAGTTTPFAFGDTITPDQVNYDGNYPYGNAPKGQYRQKTVAVDAFEPNAWGLYNMHGNVWEWCADWYESYPSGAVTDPTGPSGGSDRVLRGGSWDSYAQGCRSAVRGRLDPGNRIYDLGFRPARSLR